MHITGYGDGITAARAAAHAEDTPFPRSDTFKTRSRIFKNGTCLLYVTAFQHAGQTGFSPGQGRADKPAVGNGFG